MYTTPPPPRSFRRLPRDKSPHRDALLRDLGRFGYLKEGTDETPRGQALADLVDDRLVERIGDVFALTHFGHAEIRARRGDRRPGSA